MKMIWLVVLMLLCGCTQTQYAIRLNPTEVQLLVEEGAVFECPQKDGTVVLVGSEDGAWPR